MSDALREQQALFLRALRWPTGVADFLAHADAATKRAFATTFVDAGDLDAVARMEVYAESFYWRLHDALAEQFAVTAWLLGDATFRNLATDFVLERPSEHWDLHRFGDRFPQFVATHRVEEQAPGLSALARVEHVIARALHLRDQDPLPANAMAEYAPAAWPALRFVFSDSVALESGPWPYPALRVAMRAGESAPTLDAGAGAVPPPDEAVHALAPMTHTLVWRHGGRVFHRAVDAGEAAAIRACVAGRRFEHLCELAAREPQPRDDDGAGHDSSVARVVERLRSWFARGMIVAVD